MSSVSPERTTSVPLNLINRSLQAHQGALESTARREPGHGLPPSSSSSSSTSLKASSIFAAREKSTLHASDRTKPKSSAGGKADPLQFVNYTELSQLKDKRNKHIVKSHANRHVNRAKRRLRGDSESEERQNAGDVVSRSVTPSVKQNRLAALGPAAAIYGSIPENTVSSIQVYRFLNHYATIMAHSAYPLESLFKFNPMQSEWLRAAISDEVLFHTSIFAAAAQICLTENTTAVVRQRDSLAAQVYGQLSRRLSTTGQVASSTIASVVCLALLEVARVDVLQWKMHMAGVRKMLHLFPLTPENEYMIYKAHRADIDGATTFLTEPFLSPIPRTRPSLSSSIRAVDALSDDSLLIDALLACEVDLPVLATFIDLARFSAAIEYALTNPGDHIIFHPRAFEDDSLSLQRELLTGLPVATGVTRAVRIAGLIFMRLVTRLPGTHHMNLGLRVQSLKESLQDILHTEVWQTASGHALVLWMLFMGGVAAPLHSDRRLWFALEAKTLLESLFGWRTWEATCEILKTIFWIDTIYDTVCEEFYMGVEMLHLG